MIKVVYCHTCNGTGSRKTIDDCEVCKGIGTYRVISGSTIKKYNVEKLDIPRIEAQGQGDVQNDIFPGSTTNIIKD